MQQELVKVKCTDCGGRGKEYIADGHHGQFGHEWSCTTCNGSGKVNKAADRIERGDNWVGLKDVLGETQTDGLGNSYSLTPAIRTFKSGATRDSDAGKHDYFGFTSALVTQRFGEYMHKNRVQSDGSLRASDNWKNGFDPSDTVRSLVRHVEDVKLHMEGLGDVAREGLEDALCAVMFNAQSMLLDLLKKKRLAQSVKQTLAESQTT